MQIAQHLRRTAIIAGASAVLLGVPASVANAAAGCGTTLYVSPTGSDTAVGSVNDPLRTPQVAVDRLGRGGGTLQLAGGPYWTAPA